MSFQQSGGSRTPFPLRYFDGSGVNINECPTIQTNRGVPIQTVRCLHPQEQLGGNPTPRPLRYFNPNAQDGRGSAGKCACDFSTHHDVANMFYRSDFAKATARRLSGQSEQNGGQCPFGGPGLGMGPGNCPFCPFAQQTGGGPVGAPMTIPNFGQNQNIGHQTQDSSRNTTGFSYRFNTRAECSPFCNLTGTNLPTFNQVNRNC